LTFVHGIAVFNSYARVTPTTGRMTHPAPAHLPTFDLAAFGSLAELEDESLQLLRPEFGAREFVAELVGAERYADAARLLAHLLPRREAVFWAWTSARRVLDPEPPAAVTAAVEGTGRWIAEPAEENRRPLLEIAESAGFGTPAGCTALAVFLSGNIAPPEVHPVEPDPFAASKAIGGAVILAAVSTEPEKAEEKFREFLSQGLDIGRRVGLWPADPALP
jgi:hypothetical protein